MVGMDDSVEEEEEEEGAKFNFVLFVCPPCLPRSFDDDPDTGS